MATAAPDSTAPVPHGRRAAALPPELDPAAVRTWQTGGGSMIDLLTRARALGPVSRFVLGGVPTVLVTAPEGVHHVLALHADRYVKRSHRARALLGDGVLSAAGEPWKSQRRLLQPHFTGQGVRRLEHHMEAAAQAVADGWTAAARSGEPRDLAEDMRRYAMDVIWRVLTGHRIDDASYHALQAGESILAALPTLPGQEIDPAATADLARIDDVAHAAIARARHTPPGEDGPGLLHTLLDAGREHPAYTDRLIRDELVTLLVAGYETTATTLTWLYRLLDRHPGERTRALDAGPAGSPARAAAVRALVGETMRLHPVAWLLPRHATEDDVVAGHLITAGSTVLTCPYLTHRDPGLWPEPDGFRPGRFLPAGERPAGPGAYFPFGLGPRACLGAQLAQREADILLDRLLPAFVPQLHESPAGPVFGFTLRPGGPTPATITAAPAPA
ncbi:cytochrome P450 [Kitasatospora sp. NE20-6]|uniref:cytochrome P450 n=1 Tax=Kitasatospora sp. NE20-6 TaxID=2859066 RepID=UPI0034DB9A07